MSQPFVIRSECPFRRALFENVVRVEEEERKSGSEVGDEFVRQRAQRGLNVGRELSVVILFVAQRTQQIAH